MAQKCPTCEKTVYWAEQVYSLGKSWHKLCLKCDRCSKLLTAGGHAERDGSPYCYIPCYATLFGPRGVNIGGAGSYKYDSSGNNSPAAVDDSEPEVEDKTVCVPKEPEDEGATFSTSVETPKKKKTWALKVVKRIRDLLAGRLRRIKQRRGEDKASSELDSKIISTGAISHTDETPVTYSNTVDSAPMSEEKRARAPKGPEKAGSNTTVAVFGVTKLCPRCNKKVYFAEKVTSLGKDWHRPCLSCERCRKTLSPGSHAEHNGLPYCHKPCYADMFGPHVVTSWRG